MGGDLEIMDYSNLLVCVMGLCTVFIGLICIIILGSVMSYICTKTDRVRNKQSAAPAVAAPVAPAVAAPAVTPEMVAAVSAVIAEEMGTSVEAIRIVSMKKL